MFNVISHVRGRLAMQIDGRKDRIRRKTVLVFPEYRLMFGWFKLRGEAGAPLGNPEI